MTTQEQAQAEPRDGEELQLLARYERARREAQEQWMRVKGNREASRAVTDAARDAGALVPMWAMHALTMTHNQAYGQYHQALERETGALADLSRWEDRKIAGLSADAAALAAGQLPRRHPDALQDWEMSADGSRWRTVLRDGRTAVIERLDAGGSFLPTVYESAAVFETGPVCDGLLPAANWAAVQVAQ